jgi:hypothetical protein
MISRCDRPVETNAVDGGAVPDRLGKVIKGKANIEVNDNRVLLFMRDFALLSSIFRFA